MTCLPGAQAVSAREGLSQDTNTQQLAPEVEVSATRGEVRGTADLRREEAPKTLPPLSCVWDEPEPVLPATAMHHHIRLENYF